MNHRATNHHQVGSRAKRVRLDKVLADAGAGSRKEVRQLIQTGRVTVDGQIVLDPGHHIDIGLSQVELDGHGVRMGEITLMLNKPVGVITATHDMHQQTVMDLIAPNLSKGLIAAGRLDKDTEGLLILTSDGALCHQVISPRRGIEKEYVAEVVGDIPSDLSQRFLDGLRLRDGTLTKPAKYRYLAQGTSPESAQVSLTITEGKYHQVKRMFAACGLKVVRLRRVRIGSLRLDEALRPGQYRELSDEEIRLLLVNPV